MYVYTLKQHHNMTEDPLENSYPSGTILIGQGGRKTLPVNQTLSANL